MADNPQGVKDAPTIANAVDPNSIQERLKTDNYVAQFAKLGAKLLEETEKPNIITLAQFEPFIPLYNMDKERYEEDERYRLGINRLYNEFIRGLSINLYQPTIVIRSHEDPTNLYFLDRRFTRIKSDNVEGRNSLRDTVPAAISKTANTTRDQMILEASIADLMIANNTPEQRSYFARIRMESSLIQKNFVEKNLSSDKRLEIIGTSEDSTPSPSSSSDYDSTMLLDDDD